MPAQSIDDAQKNIQDWFKQLERNITRSFRLKQTAFAFFVGLLVALLLNVDTLQVARTLFLKSKSTGSAKKLRCNRESTSCKRAFCFVCTRSIR